MGKPESHGNTWKHRYGWEDNIEVGLKRNRMRGRGVDLVRLGQGHVAGCCEYSNEILGFYMFHIGALKKIMLM